MHQRKQGGWIGPAPLKLLGRLAIASLAALVLVASLGGCATLGFYQQAVVGQLRLLSAREDVARLLAQPDLEPTLRAALLDSQAVLEFADRSVGLAADGRYSAYVELSRDYVVWNLVVTPVDSVTPQSWCFPVAGCVSYRGYFARERAEANAAKFDPARFDTWVGGVAAYSTLGWFDDPLLSSFIHWPRPARAELLLHELAHSRLYLAGDTPFNESFATFVAERALPRFLETHPVGSEPAEAADTLAAHRQRQRETARFNGLLLRLREQLAADFAALSAPAEESRTAGSTSGQPDVVRELRVQRFAEAEACFAAVADEFSDNRFQRFFTEPPNLARLSLVSAYNRWVGAFAALHAEQGSEWEPFFSAAQALSKQPADVRLAELQRLSEQQIQAQRDDKHSDDIQCEAFTNHAADGDVAG